MISEVDSSQSRITKNCQSSLTMKLRLICRNKAQLFAKVSQNRNLISASFLCFSSYEGYIIGRISNEDVKKTTRSILPAPFLRCILFRCKQRGVRNMGTLHTQPGVFCDQSTRRRRIRCDMKCFARLSHYLALASVATL